MEEHMSEPALVKPRGVGRGGKLHLSQQYPRKPWRNICRYVRTCIGKARVAFHQLKNTWGSREVSVITKIQLFIIASLLSQYYFMKQRPAEPPSPP
ncbi:ATP-dependent zinc metalloprotease YME1L1 X2 [Biomphalaria glabrata]|nr:ATP-dependent zinc metalloprotease YME1L1 X2 [Biomphalaria glabrata]